MIELVVHQFVPIKYSLNFLLACWLVHKHSPHILEMFLKCNQDPLQMCSNSDTMQTQVKRDNRVETVPKILWLKILTRANFSWNATSWQRFCIVIKHLWLQQSPKSFGFRFSSMKTMTIFRNSIVTFLFIWNGPSDHVHCFQLLAPYLQLDT